MQGKNRKIEAATKEILENTHNEFLFRELFFLTL